MEEVDLQTRLQLCSFCFRTVADRRHVKGSIRLKHSGCSASEVIGVIIGQKIPVISLCFRCYRLILGTDYHQQECKRLRDMLVNIYRERGISLEKARAADFMGTVMGYASGSAAESGVDMDVSFNTCSDGELPFQSELNSVDIIGYHGQDSGVLGRDLQLDALDPSRERQKTATCTIKTKIVSLERTDSNQERHIVDMRNKGGGLNRRSTRRRKRLKKMKDFEYYADFSRDLGERHQVENNGGDMNEGMQEDSDEKKYCPICCKYFLLRKDYFGHPCTQNLGKNLLKCKSCEKNFSVRQQYLKHTRSCYKNIPVKCHICRVELQSAAYLPRHLEAFHDGASLGPKGTLCDQCGRTFSRKEAMERHQAQVHGIAHGIHQCSKCGKTFLHTALLMEHMRAHKGYPCPDCHKVFTCMSNLNLHKRTSHLNKALYVCSLCNKRWRFHTSYTNHMRKVHGRGQFECSTCKMLFSAESAFERHKEVCAGVPKKPSMNKINSGPMGVVKRKKNNSNVAGAESAASSQQYNKTTSSVFHSKVNMNPDSSRNKNYLRLKKVVRKVSSSKQQQSLSTAKNVNLGVEKHAKSVHVSDGSNHEHPSSANMGPAIGFDSSQLMSQDTELPSSSEIIIEAVDDLNSDCQYVILVEDGTNEQK